MSVEDELKVAIDIATSSPHIPPKEKQDYSARLHNHLNRLELESKCLYYLLDELEEYANTPNKMELVVQPLLDNVKEVLKKV